MREIYLELLKKVLMDVLQDDRDHFVPMKRFPNVNWKVRILRTLDAVIRPKGFNIVYRVPSDLDQKMQGKGVWPEHAQTMVGIKRLNNIQYCIEQILKNDIPGDFIETGVWRGGSTIFMRAVLRAYDVTTRYVWVADSFEGLPKPDETRYPADKDEIYHQFDELRVSIDDVKRNFSKFGLLDDKVRFLKGWFRDTLPTAPIERLALLRLDGDMYESTMDGLVNLYPKLSVGGYIIVDDYHSIAVCRQAVTDYRLEHNISEEIEDVDWTAVYWRKAK